jgi:MoaA/NifB/PqqE/SkfB family radical SAM enzyme
MDYPERLNLAIANNCFVHCPGCYQQFGKSGPDLIAFKKTIARFLEWGVDKVTISGGDPLTIPDLLPFLHEIRAMGITHIKTDTVGTSLLIKTSDSKSLSPDMSAIAGLTKAVDILGIPLDGWDNESVYLFRKGRKYLFDELCLLLKNIDSLSTNSKIIINTVAHKGNIDALPSIYKILQQFSCIAEWHIFQYTPTDNVAADINNLYETDNERFSAAKDHFLQQADAATPFFHINFYSVNDRLGYYLLVNSGGEAWLPDHKGKSIQLGVIHNNEEVVVKNWIEAKRLLKTGYQTVQ